MIKTNFQTIKSSTPRECQRRIFIDSLYKELDRVAANTGARNSKLVERASRLMLEEGFPKDACVDLLTIEGFDSNLARQCIDSISVTKVAEVDKQTETYDYSFEDHEGRIFTGRELDNLVEAESEGQAETLVKGVLASFDPPVRLLSITKSS